jgi:centromere protein C
LKEGKLDEHGMEELDGMFSSPEKSPVKGNGYTNNGNDTLLNSEDMEMGNSMYIFCGLLFESRA